MIKVLAEVWIHSNAETGEPCEVSIVKIKSDEFLCFDFLRFFLEYDFDDRIDEFNFLKLDEWHVIELYFEYEDGWYFECAKNTKILNNEDDMQNQHWCMCVKLKDVARDYKSTCSICGGRDAYGLSTERPEDKKKTITTA